MSRRSLAALVLVPVVSLAQAKPAVPASDYGKWESSAVAALSSDGRWLAWQVTRVDESMELRARRLDRDTLMVLPQGSAPVFAAAARWMAYTVQPAPAEREKLERDKKPIRSTTALVSLTTGAVTMIAPSTSHRFSGDGRYLAVRLHPSDAAKRDAADLLVRDLEAGTTQVFGNVATYQWSDVGALLAFAIETEGNAGNGIQLLDAPLGRLTTLASSADRYRGLAWRRGAADLVALRSQVTAAFRDTNHVVLSWRGVGSAAMTAAALDPSVQSSVPSDMRIAEVRVPEWTRDGSGILFGLRPRDPRRDTTAKSADGPKVSDVQVWHARDVRPIPMQKAQEPSDARRTLLAAWWLAEQRVVRVGSGMQDAVTVSENAAVAIEVSATKYPLGQMFGRPRRDVDAIDLRTGQRRRLADSVRFTGSLSPTGRLYSFFADGVWRVANTTTGKVTVLGVPRSLSFQHRDVDSPTDEFGPFTGSTWSADERWLYVGDKYDLYQLAADGGGGRRITDGSAAQVVHRFASVEPFDPERSMAIDPTRPAILSLTGEWTKETGYARLLPNFTVERAFLAPSGVSRLMKADSVPAFAFSRSRFDTPMDWWVAGATLTDARRVSALNTFQKDYAWGRAELVEFNSDSGRRLQGALFYPANYDPTRKYPMIVNTYEIQSTVLHGYLPPSERSVYNRTAWTQHGYFVYMPDIVFRWGDPGRSYLEALIPAVNAVIAKGVVDSARIGLVGHSWGGYEATYAPTQTNLFATSIAGAPITNFLSFAGAFHWNGGMPEFDHWETGQARMVRPPWEDFDGHVRNSPAAFVHKLQRPMLMVFGDADGTVDWHQGVEFYNFARRAGKEDFVMLVYPGEDHGLRKKENQVDYHRRILEWFGHYLKGEPAPTWIRRGITWQERKAVVEPKP